MTQQHYAMMFKNWRKQRERLFMTCPMNRNDCRTTGINALDPSSLCSASRSDQLQELRQLCVSASISFRMKMKSITESNRIASGEETHSADAPAPNDTV
jgi:hypothetical protein